eukprot:Gb_36855 [translate_table: standard]
MSDLSRKAEKGSRDGDDRVRRSHGREDGRSHRKAEKDYDAERSRDTPERVKRPADSHEKYYEEKYRDEKYSVKEDRLRDTYGNIEKYREHKHSSREEKSKDKAAHGKDDKYSFKEERFKEERPKEGRRDKEGRKIKDEKDERSGEIYDGYEDHHRSSRERNDVSRKVEMNYKGSGYERSRETDELSRKTEKGAVERSIDGVDRVKKDSHSHSHSHPHGGERESRGDGRSHKRRERESEERKDKSEKRKRDAEDTKDARKGRGESKVAEDTTDARKSRGEKRKFEEDFENEQSNHDLVASSMKRQALEVNSAGTSQTKDGQKNLGVSDNGSPSVSAVQQGPPIITSRNLIKPLDDADLPSDTKVSTVFTTNTVENKGDNVARSHELPAKNGTDGTASTGGKRGSLSLDALAKAKKALQIQKELSEKLKKLPQLNKSAGPSSVATSFTVAPTKTVGPTSSTAAVSISSSAPSAITTATAIQTTASTSTSISAATSMGNMRLAPSMTGVAGLTPGHANIPNYEAVKRAQELAAKLGFHQDPEFMPFLNMFPGQVSDEFGTSGQQRPAKAPVLRLDAHGREIDEHGNVIDKPKITNLSTLKVNINKQKKEAFQILRPELDEDPVSNPHFDSRMGIDKTKLLRPKRMTFQFVEEGRWSKQAEILKFKSQFGEAQAKELKIKQAQLAKAKAEADINPNLIEVSERVPTKEEKPKDPVPDVEWWDVVLLPSGTYNDVTEGNLRVKMEKLTIYVEHPQPIEPPAEPRPPPPQPLKLTKKEQKKLRTQRRLAKEKDRQEMIRQGLIEPPKPKVKMSNLMKVLGSEATQDPTRLEMEIRSAAAEREQAHVDRNIARKLTPAERREKKERKLFEDPNTLETIVSVYKINDLSHPQTRFKVDINAQENRLSGCAVISNVMSVVVVEGGSKSIKRYGKLMLRRINWAAAVVNEEDEDHNEDHPVNKCELVWQGSVAKPSFDKFVIQQCRTEAAARKFFADAGVAHYWDLAVNFSDDQIS